jgi:serine/threonine protein kinase
VLLADFGIARLTADTAHLTAHGLIVGTVGYLSPEQVTGGDVGPAADVYALGLTLLEALSGVQAYPGSAPEAALARLAAPPSIPDALPPPWPDLLRRMTALDAADRPTAAEVAAILTRTAPSVDPATATIHLFARPPTRPTPGPGSTAVDVDADAVGHRHTLLDQQPPSASPTRPSPTRPSPTRPSRQVVIAAAILVVLAGLLVAVLALNPARPTATSNLPAGLPPQLTEDLRGLHEAVNG